MSALEEDVHETNRSEPGTQSGGAGRADRRRVCGERLRPAPVGESAPDFTLQASDGKSYSLSKLKGRAVVLAWFPKAFTAG